LEEGGRVGIRLRMRCCWFEEEREERWGEELSANLWKMRDEVEGKRV